MPKTFSQPELQNIETWYKSGVAISLIAGRLNASAGGIRKRIRRMQLGEVVPIITSDLMIAITSSSDPVDYISKQAPLLKIDVVKLNEWYAVYTNLIAEYNAKLPTTSTCCECNQLKDIKHFRMATEVVFTLSKTCNQCKLNWHRKSKYGLTSNEFDAMLKAQNFKCAICGIPFSECNKQCLDHCHKTKAIRGILCSSCNKGLGHFFDDPAIIENAIKYLNEAKTCQQ